jgi:membrane protein required for colicin V production
MVDLAFTVADVGVLAVLAISALLAFARGFIKELLAVVGWVGAVFAVLYGFPPLKSYAREVIPLALLADAITATLIFIAALLILSVFSHVLAKRVRDSSLNLVDRSLGFMFGLLRGAVVVCIAYLILVQLLPRSEHPAWIRNALTLPAVERGGQILLSLVPDAGWRDRPNGADGGGATRR